MVENYLDITEGSIIAVVGCGGKTSLIELIADTFRDKKVLVTPTTRMFPIKASGIMLCETMEQCAGHEPQTGIQCLGLLNTESGKLEALPGNFLADTVLRYDITLIEADGSRGLPCKGWLADEPVIPPYCTQVVGLVTMNVLGKPATKDTVCHLPEFLALTGLKEGQAITAQALEAMVCDPHGMFKKRDQGVGSGEWGMGNREQGSGIGDRGSGNREQGKYLLVNQVGDEATACAALSFLETIKEKYPGRFKRLLYGSVHLDVWQEV
jgi:probable selenium-dependent hydroxylase accessory protein YqeC